MNTMVNYLLRNALLFLSLLLLMSSCASNPVLTARGTTAFLPDDNKFNGVDLQFGAPLPMGDDNRKSHIDVVLSVGYAKSELTDLNLDEDSKIQEGITAALGGYYFFSNRRFQPFIGAELGYLSISKKSDNNSVSSSEKEKNAYFIVSPNAGLRFYFSNRLALTGSVGYQYHAVTVKGIETNMGGVSPSVGLTYVLTK